LDREKVLRLDEEVVSRQYSVSRLYIYSYSVKYQLTQTANHIIILLEEQRFSPRGR